MKKAKILPHKIAIFVESRYPADRKAIRKAALKILKENNLKSRAELGVNIVGDRKMSRLNRKYRGEQGAIPVMTFSQLEAAAFPKVDAVLRLGDVVISYPQARGLAKEKNKLVDEIISDLVEHGVRQLCSI